MLKCGRIGDVRPISFVVLGIAGDDVRRGESSKSRCRVPRQRCDEVLEWEGSTPRTAKPMILALAADDLRANTVVQTLVHPAHDRLDDHSGVGLPDMNSWK